MYFEELYPLNEEHHVYVVRDADDGRIYVKKVLTVYDADIYSSLYDAPVNGLPRIVSISEDRAAGTLTVIEEYISGRTIEEMIEKGHLFDEKETIGHILALCEILKQLHSKKIPIIHRDIKPSNVMLTDDGRLILLDMNAGRFDHGEASRDTRLIGTGGYAAPEQYGFGTSGPYTDIYGTGMLMKAMLTGDAALSTEYEGDLKNVIQKCCAVDKEDRYPDIPHLMQALNTVQKDNIPKKQSNGIGKAVLFASAAAIIAIIIFVISFFILSQKFAGNTHPEGGYFPAHENEINTPSLSSELLDEICTSYKGSSGSALTIKRDGSAVYYCDANEYSEILCPWKYEDGVLTVSLSKLHCDISAVVKDDDLSSLRFCSQSKNWDDEDFVRLDKTDETYEKKALRPYDKKFTVNKNGCLEIRISDMVFEFPKYYCEYPREKYSDQYAMVISADPDKKEVKSIAFSCEKYDDFGTLGEFMPGAARLFGAGFLENAEPVGEVKTGSIQGHKTYDVELKGILDREFGYLYGRDTKARVLFICDEDKEQLIKMIMSDSCEDEADIDLSEFYTITDNVMGIDQ